MNPRPCPLNHPSSIRGVPVTNAPVSISLPLLGWSQLPLVRLHTLQYRWVVFAEWSKYHCQLADVSCDLLCCPAPTGMRSTTILIFSIFIITLLHSLKIVTLKQARWKLMSFFSGGIGSCLPHLDRKVTLMHVTLGSSVFSCTNISTYHLQATENRSVALTLRKQHKENWLTIVQRDGHREMISDILVLVDGCILLL